MISADGLHYSWSSGPVSIRIEGDTSRPYVWEIALEIGGNTWTAEAHGTLMDAMRHTGKHLDGMVRNLSQARAAFRNELTGSRSPAPEVGT